MTVYGGYPLPTAYSATVKKENKMAAQQLAATAATK